MGATPGFFLVIAGELSPLRLGVRQSGGWYTELWDTTEEESSTTSALMADRQLRSELLKTLMCSPDDEVLSTEAETGTLKNNQIMFIHLVIEPRNQLPTDPSVIKKQKKTYLVGDCFSIVHSYDEDDTDEGEDC